MISLITSPPRTLSHVAPTTLIGKKRSASPHESSYKERKRVSHSHRSRGITLKVWAAVDWFFKSTIWSTYYSLSGYHTYVRFLAMAGDLDVHA